MPKKSEHWYYTGIPHRLIDKVSLHDFKITPFIFSIHNSTFQFKCFFFCFFLLCDFLFLYKMDFLGLFLYLQNINKKILLVKNDALEDNVIKNRPKNLN